MISKEKPRVAVLLAAYNGEKYIEKQTLSIIRQIDVSVHIYISIDESIDKTEFICEKLSATHLNIKVLNNKKIKFGSAGANFYHLFRSVDFSSFDFIALSDQDDIWKENKLARGVEIIKSNHLDGYSSDVECFWDNGKKKNKVIKKSYPQKKYDYIFEPAGPGCTYILTNKLGNSIKNYISMHAEKLPFHHDWFIYAYSRINKLNWMIDDHANILYRQHERNQVGANSGFNALKNRLTRIVTRQYRREVLEIYNLHSFFNKTKNNPSFLHKEVLKNPLDYRRRKKEAILLFILFYFKLI